MFVIPGLAESNDDTCSDTCKDTCSVVEVTENGTPEDEKTIQVRLLEPETLEEE